MFSFLKRRLAEVAAARAIVIEANDGIIATAGLLQGFAGAGVSNRVLLFSAAAAAIAGALSVGGAAWAEDSALRESQLLLVEDEQRQLTTDLEGEIEELTQRWENKGLEPALARQVAEQLTARDALGAQLESEYGFTEPMSAQLPVWAGIITAFAYAIGASIPFLITYFAPVDVETWAIVAAVMASLVLTSLWAARSSNVRLKTMLTRTLVVGGITLLVSYAIGELLL